MVARPLLLFLLLMGCQPEPVAPSGLFNQQEGFVEVVTATRGSYQFILRPADGTGQVRYLITNYPDSLRLPTLVETSNQRPFRLIFSGEQTAAKKTVYGPNPDDTTRPLYDLPGLVLTVARRKI